MAISHNHGVEYVAGDGSMANSYIAETDIKKTSLKRKIQTLKLDLISYLNKYFLTRILES